MILFNEDKVTKLFSEILQALQLLEDLRKLSLDGFIAEPHKISSAKYNLIVAIECVIDLCNHIISKNNFRAPEDYADTFKIIAEKGLISEELQVLLIKMARFRNRLVHKYLYTPALRRRECTLIIFCTQKILLGITVIKN